MSLVAGNSTFSPFSFEIGDPFDALASDVDRLSALASCGFSVFADAKIDWKETDEAHVFKADLPGVKKEQVTVAVEEGRVLQISGERSVEEDEKAEMWHRVERSSGKFLRRFRLPNDANADEVKASMVNGVLTVIVPKVQAKCPEVKTIKISG